MKDFEVYLFDFDGTLVDSHDSLVYVFQGAYKKVGVDIKEEDVWHLMRTPIEVGYMEHHAPLEKGPIFAKEIIELLNSDKTVTYTKIYDETLEVISKLKSQGKTLGIVTSNNVKHVKDVLKFLNIDESYFSVFVGNEETKKHKPYPDPILKALEILNRSIDETCYVGDALDDCASSDGAGTTSILVDRISEYNAEKYIKIKTLKELIND